MRKLALSCLAFALAWVWGASAAQAAITLTLTPSASTVALGGALTLTATVSGTPNTGLTWSVNGVTNGNSSTGALTGSGLTRTYTAPAVNCPNPNPVTFKIVSAADNTTSATATATVTSTIVVTISPTSKSLALGGTQLFTAAISNTTNTALNWYVNGVLNGNATQGTLTGTGLTRTYTAPAVNVPNPNPAVIKVASAADPSKFKTANVTVTDTIAVTLSPTSVSLALSGTQLFTATISNTTNTALNWYVNGVLNGNATQGTLTGTGLTRTYTAPPVNVPSPNPAVIKAASAADPSKFKTANVTVTDTIAVTLSPTSVSLALSGTQLFTATISNTANTAQNWYVNGVLNGNATQGTLTGTGLTRTYTAPPVNVPSPNPAVIKVASAADPSKFKTASVTVTTTIAVTLSPASASVALSGTRLFTATISNTTNTALNWYVNGVLNGNATQGTLTGTGLTRTYTAPPVNVPSPNPAVIKVASAADPSKFKTANVTVTDTIAVTLSPASASVALSGTRLFTATISNTTNTALSWYVNGVLNGNSTQGTLTGTGLTRTYTAPPVNVPSPNPAVIKVASAADPSKFKTASVTVTDTIAVTLSPTSVSLALSGTQLFTATISNTTNTALNWYVNGVLNGNSTQGTLTGTGLTRTYTAPAVNVPSPNPAVIEVASVADLSKYKTASVTVTDSIAVTLSPTSASLALGGTQVFTATISNTTNTALNWYVNGVLNGNATQGTLTGTGLTRTYTAPAVNVPNPNWAIIKVVSAADRSKFGTANVWVTTTIAVTLTPSSASLAPGGTQLFTATISNTTNTALNWYVNGVLNGASTQGTLTGTALTRTYTAPTVDLPNPDPAVIEVASAADPSKSATAKVTVPASCSGAPTGHESMLNGQYAFLVQGYQVAIDASFHADGAGNVTGGDFDINEGTAGATDATINASSYTVGLDPTSSGNLGCVMLSLSNGSTTVFRFSLGGLSSGVFSKGRIIEYDDATGTGSRGSGVLLRQDTTSFSLNHLQPHYAFGVDGVNYLYGAHFASGGSFTVDTSGKISNAFADTNDDGAGPGETTGGAGKINAISSTTGRATMSLTFDEQTTHQAAYMVNADEFFIIGTDPLSSVPIYSGRAIVTASSFSQSSLSGNYIINTTDVFNMCSYSEGGSLYQIIPCPFVKLALVNLDSTSGTYSGTVYGYEGIPGVDIPYQLSGATYAVDATSGRVTLSDPIGMPGSGVVYIATPTANTEPISAFFVQTVSVAGALFGFAEFQPSATYGTSALAGKYFYGTEDPGANTFSYEAGVINIASGGALTGTQYQSGPNGLATESVSGTVSVGSNGVGSAGDDIVAITNGTRLFVMPYGSPYINGVAVISAPAVIVIELQ